MKYVIVCVLLSTLPFIEVWGVLTENNLPKEIELKQKLLRLYDPTVRPVLDIADTVNITVGLALQQIIDIDEKKQLLKATFWMRLYWTDMYLRWNSTEYDDIKTIRLHPSSVWVPDMCVYDGLEPAVHAKGMQDFLLTVNNEGYIMWLAPLVIESVCHFNVRFFPYDTQYCPVVIGSWSYHGWQVDLFNRSAEGDSSNFRNNVEWSIVRFPVKRIVTIFGCCPEPFPVIEYSMVLRRSAGYYVQYLYIPSVVIIAASLFAFFLPPGSDAKIDLAVTGLLSQTVFLLLISDLMPPDAHNPPLLGECLSILLCLQASAVVFNVLVKRFHDDCEHKTNPPKPWLMKTLNYLKYPLLLIHLDFGQSKKKLTTNNRKSDKQGCLNPVSVSSVDSLAKDDVVKFSREDAEGESINGDLALTTMHNGFLTVNEGVKESREKVEFSVAGFIHSKEDISENDSLLLNTLRSIKDDIGTMVDAKREEEKREAIVEQWRKVSAMFDRVLMFLFLIGVLCISAWFVTLQPNEESQRLT